MFTSEETAFSPAEKYGFSNFTVTQSFSLYLFTLTDPYEPVQYLVLAKAKQRKMEVGLAIKKSGVLASNTEKQETDYIYKSSYYFVDKVSPTHGFTNNGTISNTASTKTLSAKSDEIVHAISLYKDGRELYYLIDDKVYLIYEDQSEMSPHISLSLTLHHRKFFQIVEQIHLYSNHELFHNKLFLLLKVIRNVYDSRQYY